VSWKSILAATAILWPACALATLSVDVGPTGLRQLSNDGVDLLSPGYARDIRPTNKTPRIVHADGTTSIPDETPVVTNPAANRVARTYSWGVVDCEYAARGDRIVFSLTVTNTSRSDTIAALQLHLVELAFRTMPQGRSPDAGMFGTGGRWRLLGAAPLTTDPAQMPPVLFVRYEQGLIAFASDQQEGAPRLTLPFATGASKLAYPFHAIFANIAPQASVHARVSIRFASDDATDEALAGDVFANFAAAYPFDLQWSDRRPIGALFLATSESHPPTNPRGWFQNAADVDTTTAQGVAKWRERLMRYADTAIKTLDSLGAQAMITWDVEGEEFPNATYYGDPRLASRLAPETDYGSALDEYFRKFRDAGFATGVAIRPQTITIDNGVPTQRFSANPRDELLAKIDYARSRWGCTIFYVDSTYDAAGALDADVFRQIHETYPDILLLPENETFRYYAYSAPLNSFQHQNVTSTPPTVRKVYGDAFSALLATVTDPVQMNAGRDALVQAVRNGDILIVSAAYPGPHIEFVKSIYRVAGMHP